MSKVLEKLALVPDRPGVYVMKDAAGHVIYIGKAKDLKKRLSSYFRDGKHDAKVIAMVQKIADFEYFVCASEKDALGLEANLIKRHKPHYNVLLKDNKSFPYILVTDRKIEITRQLHKSGKYFGPYFNGIWANGLLDTVYDIFGIRGTADKAVLENIKSFLRGDSDFNARDILTSKMEQAAGLHQFEMAIRYRNGLRFLDKLKERMITQVSRNVNCDVFSAASRGNIFCTAVLTIRAGKIIGIQNFADENKGIQSDGEMLESFINQYYLENVMPDEVITEAVKGYKKKLLDMAAANAAEYLDTSIEKIKFKNEFTLGACAELGRILGIEREIKKIECFDISHYGGEGVVASMVVFIDGVSEKKLYRKFKMRHGQGNNDVLSMRETLMRRLRRLGTLDDSFGPAPDLIIVDGGKGQLNAAVDVIGELGIFVCALAEREEKIFVPNEPEPIILDRRSYALRLLQRIRDEAHRFAIGYQKKLR